MKIYPHHPVYHILSPKSQKEFFDDPKFFEGPESPKGSNDRALKENDKNVDTSLQNFLQIINSLIENNAPLKTNYSKSN